MLTDRERFLSLLFTAPLLAADAIIVLAGEDAEARAAFAAELYRMRPTPLYVTGGRHEPPRIQNAEAVMGMLMGHGVRPDAITLDNESQNTREQAIYIAAEASARKWRRVLLVVSGYHLPRAFLTVLRAVKNAGLDDTLHVVPVAASPVRPIPLDADMEKIAPYGVMGHVSNYAHGLAYLTRWAA